ncbi:hypothetical protein IJE86_05505 [bacterium]|nr:hypothetical protein [bacterium]
MTLYGGIQFKDTGIAANLRTMHLDSELMGIINDNINGFDKIGYQRKEAVVSSFSSIIGVHALSISKDDTVGRLDMTQNPLDLALSEKGYFQVEGPEGVKAVRDGRFKLDVDGNLLTLDGSRVLANNGMPIVFPFAPRKLEDIKVNKNGDIRVFNDKTYKLEYVATLSVVTDKGLAVVEPGVIQGYNEASNINFNSEVLELVGIRRNFEANRKMFILQNSNLRKAIQELGSAS